MSGNADGTVAKELLLDEVVTSYLEALESGGTPDRSQWLTRYSDLAAELSAFFADQDHVERLTLPLRMVAQSGSTPLPAVVPHAAGDSPTNRSTDRQLARLN